MWPPRHSSCRLLSAVKYAPQAFGGQRDRGGRILDDAEGIAGQHGWRSNTTTMGYVPFTAVGSELLFEVFSQRYERGASLVTSNPPFDEWTSVFGSERLTGARLDRLTHHVHILEMPSFRLATSKKAQRRSGHGQSQNPKTRSEGDCQRGHSVAFTTAAALVHELMEARHPLCGRMRSFDRLDDFGQNAGWSVLQALCHETTLQQSDDKSASKAQLIFGNFFRCGKACAT
jgi:IstB-like ATP binding protein